MSLVTGSQGMTCRRKRMLLGVMVPLCMLASASMAAKPQTSAGVVSAISQGSLYLDGIPHMIATVDTPIGRKRVAFSTIGVMQALQVGESVSFSGPVILVNAEQVINTKAGFFFRPAEKSMSAFMADMQASAQRHAEAQANSGIPNAVPTVVLQTSEQEEASTSERRTDLLLTIFSIVLGLLAFDRLRGMFAAVYRWVRHRFLAKPATQATDTGRAQGPAAS